MCPSPTSGIKNGMNFSLSSLINKNMDNKLFADVDKYIGDLFNDNDNALEATEQSIKDFNIPSISVSLNQGKFLHVLAKLCKAKNILEIGTLAGYSTIWLQELYLLMENLLL